MPKPFLYEVAHTLLEAHGEKLSNVCVVVPSRRAGLFLKRALAEIIESPLLGPEIMVVERLATELSGLDQADTLTLQFVLFQSYQQVLGREAEGFESFIKWSPRLLQDFNEIDRFAVNARDLYSNLTDAKTLERWGVEHETPELMEKYLQFWKKLHPIYLSFRKELKGKGRCYQGMMYREAAERVQQVEALETWMDEGNFSHIHFVGFNALNASEKIIVNHALDSGVADIWFDVDAFYFEDDGHEAGMFLREYKSWRYFDDRRFSFVHDRLKSEKRHIEIIGVPKQIGMAKTLSEILEEIRPKLQKDEITDRLALVLADEGLLIPALNSIPEAFEKVNVTMGLPLHQLSLVNAVEILLQTHERALRLMLEESRPFQIYHKDLERMLLHPFYQRMMENEDRASSEVLGKMRSYNAPFLSIKKLSEWIPQENPLMDLLTEQSPKHLLSKLARLLAVCHDSKETPLEDVEASARLYNVCEKLVELFAEFELEVDMTTTLLLYRQLVREESLEFYGEPLEGLQIMGVLETRLLSFEHLIITNVNEDTLPSGRSDNSFIPLDLKGHFRLPTHREKDAIYAYHFYRLLQGAKNVTLLFNTENDGMNSGEASRFIEQIRREFTDFHNTTIKEKVFSTRVERNQLARPFELPRGEFMMETLIKRAQKGIAPSHLQMWVKDPSEFYKKVILGQKELDEIEEVLGDRSIGNVIHNTLQRFYDPFIGSRPSDEDFKEFTLNLEVHISEEYEKENKRKLETEGRNRLASHAMMGMVRSFLKEEQKRAEEYASKGLTWTIIGVEDELKHEIEIPNFSVPVIIRGFADRIDRVGNTLVVIDYKTGGMNESEVSITALSELMENEKKSKALQLYTYAWLLSKRFPDSESFSAGIFALRSNRLGLIKTKLKGTAIPTEINSEQLQTFETLLTFLLQDIFSTEGVIKPRENESV